MKDKELTDIGQQVAKRGRPKGSGGNERKDLSWNGNENLLPGDRGRYLRHALASWDLPVIDISDEKQVEERIIGTSIIAWKMTSSRLFPGCVMHLVLRERHFINGRLANAENAATPPL